MASFRDRIYASYVSGGAGSPGRTADEVIRPRRATLERAVRDFFPSDRSARIIDLGCGYGALLHVARQKGYTSLAGVDTSAEQVSEAARLGIAGVTLGDLADALNGLGDSRVDMICCFDVIEHLDRNELVAIADAVRGVLKPGGRWLIHTPNAESPMFGRVRYGDLTHELAFTSDSLRQLAVATGFSSVRCVEDGPTVRGAASAARVIAWKAVSLLLRFYLAAESGVTSGAIVSQNLYAVMVK